MHGRARHATRARASDSADPSMDIWDDDGVAVARKPEQKQTSDDWYIDPENQRIAPTAARRRAVESVSRPNQRAAVAVPMAGQSYNPAKEDHAAAAMVAIRKLEAKQREHQRFAKELALRPRASYRGDLNTDKQWEEEVSAGAATGHNAAVDSDDDEFYAPVLGKPKKRAAPGKSERRTEKAKAGTKSKAGKKNALDVRREVRASRRHQRHPSRKAVEDAVDEIEDIQKEVDAETRKSELRQLRRAVRKAEGQQLVKYGRHVHTPSVPDVLPSTQLTGALRHLTSKDVTHLAKDRMKSLEERGLVPARMRHSYNQRKQLRPKGEVMIVKESFGGIVDS